MLMVLAREQDQNKKRPIMSTAKSNGCEPAGTNISGLVPFSMARRIFEDRPSIYGKCVKFSFSRE